LQVLLIQFLKIGQTVSSFYAILSGLVRFYLKNYKMDDFLNCVKFETDKFERQTN